jgi:hypothetical protein
MTGEIGRKLKFYHEQGGEVHLSMGGGVFYNGVILSLDIDNNLMVFLDQRVGEVPVLFEEIIRVEPFLKKGGLDGSKTSH